MLPQESWCNWVLGVCKARTRPFGEKLTLVWLMPLVLRVRVRLGVCFVLIALLSDLADFILKFGHYFHLDVALGSFTQFVHATG